MLDAVSVKKEKLVRNCHGLVVPTTDFRISDSHDLLATKLKLSAYIVSNCK